MRRLTERNIFAQESWDEYTLLRDVFLYDAIRKLAIYEELEENGKLFKIENLLMKDI